MADALPEHGPINPESPTLQEGDGADDAANPAIADGDAPTGVSILRRERYEDPRDLVGEPFIRLHESQYWRWYEQLKSEFKTRRASSQIADAFLDTAEIVLPKKPKDDYFGWREKIGAQIMTAIGEHFEANVVRAMSASVKLESFSSDRSGWNAYFSGLVDFVHRCVKGLSLIHI